MKIWQVVENDTQIRFYWYATKKEALAHEYDPPFEGATCEITSIDCKNTRAGIAEAMNFVISLTCFNEG